MPRLRTSAPSLDAYIRAELNGETVCPFCGAGSVMPGTRAGDEFGCCLTCFNGALKRATDSRARDLESEKSNVTARKRASRAGFSIRDVEVTGDDIRATNDETRYGQYD